MESRNRLMLTSPQARTVAAFIGKQICGLAVPEIRLNRLTIGLGLVPRGEV